MDIKIGNIINNYKLIKHLGINNLGNIYLSKKIIHDPITGKSSDKEFIFTVIPTKTLYNLGFNIENIQQEISILKDITLNSISSKHIASYYDSFIATSSLNQKNLIIISEYIKGNTLQEIIYNQIDTKKPFETNVLIKMMMDICQAVDYIHSNNVAHQNLKPSNIILDKSDGKLKLIDLSLSCSFSINSFCKGKPGTVYYMSPDVIKEGNISFDRRKAHDIWSIGVIFYQMANLGKNYMNFSNFNPDFIAKDIQLLDVNKSKYLYEPINNFINTILNKNPYKRPNSSQVLIMLRSIRPLCIVNNIEYMREEAIELILSLNLNIDTNVDDYSLCKILNDYFSTCKINNKLYNKKQLLKIGKMFKLNIPKDIDINDLCNLINNSLIKHHGEYSKHITEKLIYTIEVLVKLQMSKKDNVLFNKIYEEYSSFLTKAKDLNLINYNTLIDYWEYMNTKIVYYKESVNGKYPLLYNEIAKWLANIIIEIKPNTNVNGIPIDVYQIQIQEKLQ
jgi:serine/threonine protein kinase